MTQAATDTAPSTSGTLCRRNTSMGLGKRSVRDLQSHPRSRSRSMRSCACDPRVQRTRREGQGARSVRARPCPRCWPHGRDMQLMLVASVNRRRVRCWRHARQTHTADPCSAPARLVLVVGELRERRVPALRADGPGARDHQVGTGHLQRQAAALGAVHSMRPEGCDPAASGMGGQRDRPDAVSGRSPGPALTCFCVASANRARY
jgi:hypothetical protein